MAVLTNVIVFEGPLINGRFIFQTDGIDCMPDDEYRFECEYDGRDALIVFDNYPFLTVYQKLQIVSGLFHDESNFKERLFKCFFYLECDFELKNILLLHNSKHLSVSKSSIIEQIMRDYYKEDLGYVVLENDTENDILTRRFKMIELNSFIHDRFLEEVDNSDVFYKRKRVYFFDKSEKDAFDKKEKDILDCRYKQYLLQFELSEDSSEESKIILDFLKSNI